jgi:hypothetical protein
LTHIRSDDFHVVHDNLTGGNPAALAVAALVTLISVFITVNSSLFHKPLLELASLIEAREGAKQKRLQIIETISFPASISARKIGRQAQSFDRPVLQWQH